MDRRALLRGGLAGLGALVLTGRADARVRLLGPRTDGKSDDAPRTLVVVQLTGGNDGLSMVVPFGDDAYFKARSTTRIEKQDVIGLDSYRGFHPGLKGLKGHFDEGRVALIEGCGYPNPIRSHFKSYEVWHTASAAGRTAGIGWIGKLAQVAWGAASVPELVVHVGATAPYSVYSPEHPPVTFQTPSSYRWVGPESEDMEAYRNAAERDQQELDSARKKKSGSQLAIERLRGVLADANESSTRIRRATTSYKPKQSYPEDDFGEALRVVAALIDARLGARVMSVELSGFDTHTNQRFAHDALMRRLDAGLTAFLSDLRGRRAGDNVVVMVFSEFGRRVVENGSRGTDHGVAAPMLLLGTHVRGGLHGKHPSLTELDNGDLVHTTDFRSVYATLIERWFQASPERVLGARYPLIDALPG